MSVLRERVTLVWIGLVLATVVTTWVLGSDGVGPLAAAVGIVVIAGVKVRYVMLDFMELRGAPRAPRIVFQLWILAVAVMIIGFRLATP